MLQWLKSEGFDHSLYWDMPVAMTTTIHIFKEFILDRSQERNPYYIRIVVTCFLVNTFL